MSYPSKLAFRAVPLPQQEMRRPEWQQNFGSIVFSAPCPFCTHVVNARAAALYGKGKRCPCGAILFWKAAYRCQVKRELRVTNRKTREVVHRLDVSGKSEGHVERVERGLLINMADDYYVDDVTQLAPLPAPTATKKAKP